MKIVLGAIANVLVVVVLLVLVQLGLANQIADLLFALLAGAFVAVLFCLASILRGATATRVILLLISTLGGSLSAWLLGLIVLHLFNLGLMGTAAMAFDLVVGSIGAVTVGAARFEFDRKRIASSHSPAAPA